jgi:hypothetical protein
MFTFFRTSLDEPLPGSRAYLGSLQHIFVQDERSGVIEVQYAAGCDFSVQRGQPDKGLPG